MHMVVSSVGKTTLPFIQLIQHSTTSMTKEGNPTNVSMLARSQTWAVGGVVEQINLVHEICVEGGGARALVFLLW